MKAKILGLVYWNSPHEERIPVALPFFKKKEKKKRKHTNLHSRFRNGKKLVKLSHPEPLSEEECR